MMEKVISDTEQAVNDLKRRIDEINEEKGKLDKQLVLAEKVYQNHLKTNEIIDLAGYLYELVSVQGRHIKYSGDAIKDTEARLNKSEIDLDSQLAAYNSFSTTDYGIADAINAIQDVKGKVIKAISRDFQSELKNSEINSQGQEIKFGTIETPVESPVESQVLKTPEPELRTVNFDELSTDNNSSLTSSSDDNSTTLDSLSGLFNDDNSNPFEDNAIAFPEAKTPVTTPVGLSEEKKDDMNNTIAFADALGDLRRMTSGEDNKESMSTVSENTGRQKVVNVVNAQDLFQSDSQEKDNTLTLGRAA